MDYAIVTGSSKGLGESVSELFLESGIHVIGISRNENSKLVNIAKENNTIYRHVSADLADVETLNGVCDEISEYVFTNDPSTVYLVNNAATVEPVKQSIHIKQEELTKHVNLNTIAPMVLTNYFLQKATEMRVQLKSAIVTSGAAQNPVFGWSAYCSTKASIDMYTKTVALEQANLHAEHKIIAFNPGIMDTGMQQKIRSSSKSEFIDVERFKGYKENNQLKDTESVAGVLVDILTDDNVQSGEIYQISDYI